MTDSRMKGKRGELEIVHIFRQHGWPLASRTSDGKVQAARGDIQDGPAGCHVEVKLVNRLNVPAALDQVARDANPLDLPILVHRPSRHQWMATVPLRDLLDLLALKERG